MNKRIVLFIVLLALLAGGAIAQTHWISGEIYGPGAGARYEYMISPSFTLGGYFSFIGLPIPVTEFLSGEWDNYTYLHSGGGITGRWYIFARRFFTELSLGFNSFEYDYREDVVSDMGYMHSEYNSYKASGFCISPGIGWTIDVGRAGGFFISVGAKLPITLGDKSSTIFVPYLGLGGAF